MSKLGQVVEAVEKYNRFVLDQVKRARSDEKFGRELINRWNETKAKTPVTRTPTGLTLPRLALPQTDEPGEIARYLFGEGLPGEFPFANAVYREMYLAPDPQSAAERSETGRQTLSKLNRPIRNPQSEEATRRFGPRVVAKLRGTVQADILKEVQAQNEIIFPLDFSLRMLGDMVEFTTRHMPRWYPISISGYHIAEAGATPVQQAAFTLANGFAYVDLFRKRGMDVDRFGPRLSFFLDSGMDVEYLVLGRVCRRLWAIAMRDV